MSYRVTVTVDVDAADEKDAFGMIDKALRAITFGQPDFLECEEREPPEPDMNAVSFSERVELESRDMLRRGW